MAAEKSLHDMTTEELGQLFPVILQQYNPLWAHLFKLEKESIASLFQPSEIIRIEHIGSTAIPGILPKNTKTTGRRTLMQNIISSKRSTKWLDQT